jgi:toxin FitB
VIVLDTNVLSEAMRTRPDKTVATWLSGPYADDAYTTAISVGEILTGIGMLPRGKRRDRLRQITERLLEELKDRVLAYDTHAATIYAQLHEKRRIAGRPLSVEDGMIASICARENARLATRNVRDFADLEIELVNPWESPTK